MSDCSALVTRLDLQCDAAEAAPSGDAKKLRNTVKTLRLMGFTEQANDVEASIPEAVTVNKAEGNDLANALAFLDPDDDAVKAVIARWEAVRPSRGSNGPRKPQPTDNPKATWIAVYFGDLLVTSYMRNSGGAITSLRQQAREATVDHPHQPLDESVWKANLRNLDALIYGDGGTLEMGEFTITVKV